MSYVRPNAVPGPGVTRTAIARRPNLLGAFVDEPWLRSYPNGAPMPNPAGMGEYIDAPWWSNYINGDPIRGTAGQTPKQTLVVMALNQHMARRCGCSSAQQKMQRGAATMQQGGFRMHRGMGDDGGDQFGGGDTGGGDPYGLPSPDGYPSGSWGSEPVTPGTADIAPGYTPQSGETISTPSSGTVVGPGGVVYGPSGPISSVAGAPSVPATGASALTSLLNSLFRPAGYPGVTPYGSLLNTPLYRGSSISTGSIALLGILGLGVVLVANRKR